jgi:hypothetical protein
VLRADGEHEKEQMARAMHKLMAVVHEVVSPVRALEAKNAPGTSESESFHGRMEGKETEPDGQRSARSEQSEVNGCLTSVLGSKNRYF